MVTLQISKALERISAFFGSKVNADFDVKLYVEICSRLDTRGAFQFIDIKIDSVKFVLDLRYYNVELIYKVTQRAVLSLRAIFSRQP